MCSSITIRRTRNTRRPGSTPATSSRRLWPRSAARSPSCPCGRDQQNVAKHQSLRETLKNSAAKRKPVDAESAPAGQATYEMANLRPERTGLPFVVFISQRGGARHDIRVKVARGAKVRPSEMITVAIRPNVRVVRGTLDARELA